jgi:chemotaxis protein histidine kinase CheA
MSTEKSAAEIERESIQVEGITKDDDGKLVELKDDPKPEPEPEPKPEDEVEPEAEPEEEAEEETAEEKSAREAEEASQADTKTKRQVERMQKRIDALTAKSRTTDAENAELKRLLDAKQADGDLVLTEEEVERRAELKAEAKAIEREFEQTCNRLAKKALEIDKNFTKNVNEMAKDIGLIPPVMIGILDDLDNGAAILAYLAVNIDEAEDIYKMSDGRKALALAKLDNKLTKKIIPKPISKVPAPNANIGGGNRMSSTLNDSMSDEDWIKKRNDDRRKAGKW